MSYTTQGALTKESLTDSQFNIYTNVYIPN